MTENDKLFDDAAISSITLFFAREQKNGRYVLSGDVSDYSSLCVLKNENLNKRKGEIKMTKTEKKHLEIFKNEIEKRGGETEIVGAYGTTYLSIEDTSKSEGRKVWLVSASGWRQYSRRFGARRASLAYLCGYDDNGPWAVRVPGTFTIRRAIDYLIPKEVKIARAEGRRVTRQGDVYAIEIKRHSNRHDDYDQQIGDHEYYHRARVMLHPEHKPMIVPSGTYKFVQQKSLGMGRGAGAGWAAD